jgi:hypothetical protein
MVSAKIAIPAIALAGLIVTLTAMAALSSSTTVPLSGTISTIGVDAFTDSACTIPCTSINVGNVAPGSTVTQTIYIKNPGTLAENLTMAVSNWSPSNAGSYLTLTWNRQNTPLAAGASISATFTLVAALNTGSLTTFSCSSTITGTQ